jgi:hypothetical protein
MFGYTITVGVDADGQAYARASKGRVDFPSIEAACNYTKAALTARFSADKTAERVCEKAVKQHGGTSPEVDEAIPF